MKIKTKKHICAAIAIIGLALTLGTAGANDVDQIELSRAIWQMIIGCIMFAGGAYKGGYLF